MALIFALRGTSLDAYSSRRGKTPYAFASSGNSAPVVVTGLSHASVFGGSAIDCEASANFRYLSYPGHRNVGTAAAGAMTVIVRFVPNFTGAPPSNQGLISFDTGVRDFYASYFQLILNTSGQLTMYFAKGDASGLHVNSNTTATKTDWVAGQAYDICFSWDGTTGAGKMKFSIQGVAFDTMTPLVATSFQPLHIRALQLGYTDDANRVTGKYNEVLIFDSAENHVYTARTDFYTTTAFDELSNVDPGIASVKTGTGYTIAGVALTGTYTGSDRWTDPGIANVRSGTAYKADSTSNNRTGTAAIPTAANVRSGTATDATTGTLAVPSAANVRSGVSVDAGTGTAAIPAASHVRSGTAIDATTGTLAVPGASHVRSGTAVDAGTGTLDLPATTNVKTGVTFDGASQTGSYTGADRWTDPGEANVLLGTAYKANSTSNNKTGTLLVVTNTFTATPALTVPNVESTVYAATAASGDSRVIEITQGDTLPWVLTAEDGDGAEYDLTGAVFETLVKKADGTILTLPDASHTADPDQVTNKGLFTIQLTTSESESLKIKAAQDVLVKITQGGAVYTLRGEGILTVKSPTLR